MSSTGNYHTGGTTVAVALSNVAGQIVLSNANNSRRYLSITNRETNTGKLYLNFSDTAPTTLLYDYVLYPGQTISDDRQQPYQGQVKGLLSVVGPETINVNEGT